MGISCSRSNSGRPPSPIFIWPARNTPSRIRPAFQHLRGGPVRGWRSGSFIRHSDLFFLFAPRRGVAPAFLRKPLPLKEHSPFRGSGFWQDSAFPQRSAGDIRAITGNPGSRLQNIFRGWSCRSPQSGNNEPSHPAGQYSVRSGGRIYTRSRQC